MEKNEIIENGAHEIVNIIERYLNENGIELPKENPKRKMSTYERTMATMNRNNNMSTKSKLETSMIQFLTIFINSYNKEI